jgi:hypothetical protein
VLDMVGVLKCLPCVEQKVLSGRTQLESDLPYVFLWLQGRGCGGQGGFVGGVELRERPEFERLKIRQPQFAVKAMLRRIRVVELDGRDCVGQLCATRPGREDATDSLSS